MIILPLIADGDMRAASSGSRFGLDTGLASISTSSRILCASLKTGDCGIGTISINCGEEGVRGLGFSLGFGPMLPKVKGPPLMPATENATGT
jgi:hypothetical protein